MKTSINLAALLTIAGGLGVAALPATARAGCGPSGPPPAASGPSVSDFGRSQFDPAAEYQAGLAAFEKGDFRKAQSSFTRVLPYAPREPALVYLIGMSRIGLGDYKGALRPLRQAVKLAPDMIVAQQDLAIAYARSGDMAKAQAVLAQLEAKAAQCDGACANADPLLAAIKAVQAAMAA